jgi:predicted ATPase
VHKETPTGERAVITRLRASNVGKFETLDLSLCPLTVFVGPNASGKTTILRTLRALALMVRTPLHHKKELRIAGVATLREFFRDPAKELMIALETETDSGKGEYELAVGIDPGKNRVEVVRERISWIPKSGTAFAYDSTQDVLEFEWRGMRVSTATPRNSTLPFLAFEHWRRDPAWKNKLRGLYEMSASFAPFYVYRFSPNAIAQPSAAGNTVSYDGAGLAAELDNLLGVNRAKFDEIVRELKKRFDHIKDVHLRTLRGMSSGEVLKLLEFELISGTRIPAGLESDGVLLTLAHLWLIHMAQDSAVGVEEPETATYPSLVRDRLKMLRELSEGTAGKKPVQVLATSHSPLLLTCLGDTELLRICEGGKVYQPVEERMMDVIHTRLAWTVE